MNDVLPVLISIGGWIGAAEFLRAYALVSKGRLAREEVLNEWIRRTVVVEC